MGEGDQIRWYEAELVSFHNFPARRGRRGGRQDGEYI
jgi:hypothetical protein